MALDCDIMDMKDIPGSCREVERRVAAAGLSMETIYKRADIHRTTWMRMREGDLDPRVSTYIRVERAVRALPKCKTSRA